MLIYLSSKLSNHVYMFMGRHDPGAVELLLIKRPAQNWRESTFLAITIFLFMRGPVVPTHASRAELGQKTQLISRIFFVMQECAIMHSLHTIRKHAIRLHTPLWQSIGPLSEARLSFKAFDKHAVAGALPFCVCSPSVRLLVHPTSLCEGSCMSFYLVRSRFIFFEPGSYCLTIRRLQDFNH